MSTLPIELWFHIAEFVPTRDLLKLIGVNRVFFNIIMTELYNQLSFISSDPRIFSEKLRSLQSPSLAERVRVLTIWPSAIRDAIEAIDPERSRKIEVEPSKTSTTRSKHTRYLSKSREYVEELLGHQKPPRPITPPPKELLPSPKERLEMFKETIRRITSVDEFELIWYIDQGNSNHAWKFTLFPEIWQSVGQNIRRLSVDIQVLRMNDVVRSCVSLPKLEELHLTLRGGGYRGDTVVPYFINKFVPTLRELSIKTIGHQELSQNFQLLGTFPRLTKLSIIMPLDAEHLQDPSGFQQLLRNHPHLRDLCIRYARCCKNCMQDGFNTLDGKHKLYGDVSLPGLRSMELGLHIPISVRTPNPLYSSIARLGNDLSSLTLIDRNLELEEIKVLLRLFPSNRLKKLSLYAQILSPQLIDSIAQACPSLNSLSLDVETVSSQDPGTETYKNPDVDGFAQALFNYAVDLDNDRWRYRNWMLSDISVMKWELKVGHQYNWACMKAIAYIVPSVRSFAGRGHMEQDIVLKPGFQELLVDLDGRTKPLDT